MKRFLLMCALSAVACKPVQKASDTLTQAAPMPQTPNKEIVCVLDETQDSIKRLLSFKHRGVKPYLGCPYYQSEWSVYPSMTLSEQSNEFERWFKSQFATLESLSNTAGADYFTDRYEFYTVVMGEGLPFIFDRLANISTSTADAINSRFDSLYNRFHDPTSKMNLQSYMQELTLLTKDVPLTLDPSQPDLAKMRAEGKVALPDSWRSKLLRIDPRRVPINGFGALGVDWFGDEFPRLRLQKYSKPYVGNFINERDFMTFTTKNERSESVKSAVFKDLETGLKAFASVYLERRNMFIEDSRHVLGTVPADPDVRMYWSYYYYRRPAEALQKLKQSRGALYVPRADEDGLRPPVIPLQCLKRVATRRFLALERALD